MWGTGTPKDIDEVNKREVCECDVEDPFVSSIGSLDLLLTGVSDPSNPMFNGTGGISVSSGSTIITLAHHPLSSSQVIPTLFLNIPSL